MHKSVFYIYSKTLLAALWLPLLFSCSAVTDDEDETKVDPADNTQTFINLTVAVSGGQNNMTRAGEKPTAGENGDGREAGFLYENAVTGISLVLYEGTGINADASTPISLIKYYPVTRTGTPETPGTSYATKTDEALYTTGNQLINNSEINLTKTYHAIVVANADLTNNGLTTLGAVRNYKFNSLYSGSETTKPARDCANFIMSSETDYELNFPGTTPTFIPGGSLYSFDGIRIERLAARIDFWASGATYNDTYKGYVYDVDATDKFVITGIMPFNLMGGNTTNGGEYLIKRVADSPTATTFTYLGDETAANFVIDPAITAKTSSGELTYYKNKVIDFGTLAGHASYSGNAYYRSIKELHDAIVSVSPTSGGYATLTDGSLSGEDVVVCYPMENALQTGSYLFSFATGVVIEGDYYQGGFSGTKTQRIYYGYLRHDGTSSSAYQARLGAAFELDKASAVPPVSPMEYGVVRNNIYRIYVSSITPESMILSLKVKKWDPFTHSWIYM